MEEKEIITIKQMTEYLQIDEHISYKLARPGFILFLKNRWSVTV